MPGRIFARSLPTRLPVNLPITATAAKSRNPDNIETGNKNQSLNKTFESMYLISCLNPTTVLLAKRFCTLSNHVNPT